MYIVCREHITASAADAGRIDALLKHAHKWSFSKDIVTLNDLLSKSGTSLFQNLHSHHTV